MKTFIQNKSIKTRSKANNMTLMRVIQDRQPNMLQAKSMRKVDRSYLCHDYSHFHVKVLLHK